MRYLMLVILIVAVSWNSVFAQADDEWDKSSVVLTGYCDLDNFFFVVENHGSNMADVTEWRFYQGSVKTSWGYTQLVAGQILTWSFPTDTPYETVRFEIDQRPGHPGTSRPRLSMSTLNCATATVTPTDTATIIPTEPTATPMLSSTSWIEPTNTPTPTMIPDTPTPTPTNAKGPITLTPTPTNTTQPTGLDPEPEPTVIDANPIIYTNFVYLPYIQMGNDGFPGSAPKAP